MGLNLLGIFPVRVFSKTLCRTFRWEHRLTRIKIICQPSISLFFVSELFVVSAIFYVENPDLFRHQFPVKRRGHDTGRKELLIVAFTQQADKNARGGIPPISR